MLFAGNVIPVLFCALKVVPLICAKIPLSSTPTTTDAGSGIWESTVHVILFPLPVPHVEEFLIVNVAKTTHKHRTYDTTRVPLLVL